MSMTIAFVVQMSLKMFCQYLTQPLRKFMYCLHSVSVASDRADLNDFVVMQAMPMFIGGKTQNISGHCRVL